MGFVLGIAMVLADILTEHIWPVLNGSYTLYIVKTSHDFRLFDYGLDRFCLQIELAAVLVEYVCCVSMAIIDCLSCPKPCL